MADLTRPERFVIVEEPYYSFDDGIKRTLRKSRADEVLPGIGDIVETDHSDHDGVDDDGDRAVLFNGEAYDIAAEVLVNLDALIKSREDRAAPLADWERELLAGPDFHEVTLAEPIIRPDKLADVLKAHGMSSDTAETVTALAVLRSLS